MSFKLLWVVSYIFLFAISESHPIVSNTSIVLKSITDFEVWALDEKDESLSSCSLTTLELGEYTILPNGTLHVEKLNVILDSSFYERKGDLVSICSPDTEFQTGRKKRMDLYFRIRLLLAPFELLICFAKGINKLFLLSTTLILGAMGVLKSIFPVPGSGCIDLTILVLSFAHTVVVLFDLEDIFTDLSAETYRRVKDKNRNYVFPTKGEETLYRFVQLCNRISSTVGDFTLVVLLVYYYGDIRRFDPIILLLISPGIPMVSLSVAILFLMSKHEVPYVRSKFKRANENSERGWIFGYFD